MTMAAATGRAEPETYDGRGTTTIADRVVERIAARAAREGGQVTGPGGVRSLAGGDEPRASASVDGSVAVVRISLGVVYPAPVGATTRAVRARVRDRVREMTGIDVRQVDIDVTRLTGADEQPRRVR
ncbi:MAG TPA: Asp23/Gls24 family envelope stress response protein [Streptosporangiaceae bacterium]|jgi:uncharacterized alkaline shock family protein YloU